MDHIEAFWIIAPGVGEIRREPLAIPGPGEVRVRALYSGISRGTESLVFQGRVPRSQYQAMRAPFQAGVFPAPVKYGYANVGLIEDGPPGLGGHTVFCLYPHQSAYVVAADAVLPVPPAVPPARAILAANLETALNGLWDAAPRIGDRIAIVGAGTVGCLSAYLAARIPGCRVELIDIDPAKRQVAQALGVNFRLPDEASVDADLVIHASGDPQGLVTALRLAGFEATVLELSWFGDRSVGLPLGEAFHSKRLTLRSSQVGAVATAQRARWTHRRRLATALELLQDAAFDALISGESVFADLPQTMARLAAQPGGALCHRIVYP
ncbi:MAG: zinc-binding alcohol dehydrogenase [Gammaproteobacteria bacterium]